MEALPGLAGIPSQAFAINNSGQVVGSAGNQAFIYSNGVLTNLNSLINPSLGLDLREATAINDQGQIVDEEYSGPQGQGNIYAYLLTPITATPEPSSFWLAGSLVAVAILRRKQIWPPN